jgi:hypothetical protein
MFKTHLVGTTRLAPVDAAPSPLPGRAAAGGPTQLDDPQASRNRHEQDPGDRRQQQPPGGEYALEGEEGDLHGIPALQDEHQQMQEDQRGEDQAGPQAACAGVLDRRRS